MAFVFFFFFFNKVDLLQFTIFPVRATKVILKRYVTLIMTFKKGLMQIPNN